jgi:hypothetical protein
MEAKDVIIKTAEEFGWLDERYVERKEIAKKMLLRGRPVEEVVEDTNLPYETVVQLI